MSDETETKFEKWNRAYNERERRNSFYVQISAKYPPEHEFVKEAKAKLDEALAEYKRVLERTLTGANRGQAALS